MTFSEYLSKRISWDPPLQLPRLSIPFISCLRSPTSSRIRPQQLDEASSDITAISYPPAPTTGRRARLRNYMHRISGSISIFRSKSQIKSEPTQAKLGLVDMPVMRSRFQLPPSPSSEPPSPASLPSASSLPVLPTSESATSPQVQEDRTIRAEQDAAYEKAQERDKERLEKLREKRIQEEELLKRLAEEEEHERAREREEAAYRHAQNDWRRWARRALVPTPGTGSSIQFAVRLPCGQRRVGNLPSDISLEAVHIFVETLLIPSSFNPENDPEDPPEGYEHHWNFRLITTNSRFVLPVDPDSKLCELEIMKKGVLLIVEEVEDTDLEEPLGLV